MILYDRQYSNTCHFITVTEISPQFREKRGTGGVVCVFVWNSVCAPRGRVVEGRYIPLHPAALEGASSGPRQSRTLGAPGGRGRERSWGRRRRGEGLTGKRRFVDPTLTNGHFNPGVSRMCQELFSRRPRGRAGPGGPAPLFPITEEP